MKTRIIAILLFAVSISNVLATAQFPDKLIYGGKEYSLHTNPMETYFSKHPDKKPDSGVSCTALWRGYVATFEIKEKELLLTDIEVIVVSKDEHGKSDWDFKSVKNKVMPESDRLKADWFSGILVLPHGERVKYVHMGYESTYSNYILLEIKKGELTNELSFDHKQLEEFKKQQLQAYKRTKDYRKQAEELKSRNVTQKDIDSILGHHILNYISEFWDANEKKEESSNKILEGTAANAPDPQD